MIRQQSTKDNECHSLDTKYIVASGVKVLVDEDDYLSLIRWRWYIDKRGYVYRHDYIDGNDRPKRMHREILAAEKGLDVDHINGSRVDNRKSNLRICTRMQNIWNSKVKSTNTSGFKGVDFVPSRGKFRARIRAGGKRINIGYFATAELAFEAYKKAAKQMHGDFCSL